MGLSFPDLNKKKNIGSGHFGEVYLVENCNKRYPNKLAMKVLPKKGFISDGLDPMTEINILKKINSIFIVKYYKFFEDTYNIYHVFDYCANGDLYHKIKKGKLDPDIASSYFKQISYGLFYLHSKNIMHRDIKPENILLDQFNNVKITDFGLSIIFKGEQKFHDISGTIYYFAPEMILRNYDYRIDIWMLGILYYEMLSGELPFYHDRYKELSVMISLGEIKYPKFFTTPMIIIISKILKVNPYERLSLSEIILIE